MDIQIRGSQSSLGTCWQVCLGKHQVNFRSEEQACQFVATLQARVRAPHPAAHRAAPGQLSLSQSGARRGAPPSG